MFCQHKTSLFQNGSTTLDQKTVSETFQKFREVLKDNSSELAKFIIDNADALKNITPTVLNEVKTVSYFLGKVGQYGQ